MLWTREQCVQYVFAFSASMLQNYDLCIVSWFLGGVKVSTVPRMMLTIKHIAIFTHLICFFSSKLIGRSRMARICSFVDMATSFLTRLCSSVTHKMTRQVLSLISPEVTFQNQVSHSQTHRLLPFSISFRMASSVKARPAGLAWGNMLILLSVFPLHLMDMLPGWTQLFSNWDRSFYQLHI